MAIWAEAWKCEKVSHREESSHRHSFSCTSTTARLYFPDISPTPYMQMISLYGVHLNTPHLLLTAVNKVEQWTNDGSSDQWSEDSVGHGFLPLHLQRKSRHKAWRQDITPSRDSHHSRDKAWHPTLMEATYRGHGEKKASRSLLS